MDAVLWLVQAIALLLEAAAAILIAVGAAEAFAGSSRALRHDSIAERKELWLRFARWLMLGLEFELAADLLVTVISPTWAEIGQLAAIAGIRIALNFFLTRDMESVRSIPHESAPLSPRARNRTESSIPTPSR